MNKLLTSGLIAATVVAGTTAAKAQSDGPHHGGTRTFLLHLDDAGAIFGRLDLGPVGDSPGDEGFIKDVATDSAGATVGTMNRTCALNVPTGMDETDVFCNGAITLNGRGQIYWQSLTAMVGPPPPPPPHSHASTALQQHGGKPTQWAIIGGTGNFRTARGQITDESVPGGGVTLIRVQLS